MARWKKQKLKLKVDHHWRSRPGYQICVIERGAIRFDFPRGWVMEPGEVSFKFYDRPHPDDDIRLEVSYNPIPPVDWSGLPLDQLLEGVVDGDHRGVTSRDAPKTVERDYMRLAWTEMRFLDSAEEREAHSRICVAIGTAVQALVTMEYWPEDKERATPVWDEALRTLRLEQYVDDPTSGRQKGPFRG